MTPADLRRGKMRINKLLGKASVVALCAISLSARADKMYYGSELG